MVAETQCRKNSVGRFLVVSLVVTLDEIRDRTVYAVTDEVINTLNQENFNPVIFREMIKKTDTVTLSLNM